MHLLELVLFPLVALAAYELIPATAPRQRAVARIAFGTFAVSAVAFDSLVGLGTGLLMLLAGSDPAAAGLVDRFFASQSAISPAGLLYLVSGASWLAGMAAAAVAGRRGRASSARAVLCVVSGVALAVSHVAPFGTAAMLALLGAQLLTPAGGGAEVTALVP